MSVVHNGVLLDALSPYSRDEQAGFVAHLAIVAGAADLLDATLEELLQHFVEVTGLRDAISDEERHARIDAFYAQVPIPAGLLALLDTTTAVLESEGAEQAHRAARRLTGELLLEPVGNTRIPGTIGGGIAGLLATRGKPPPT